MILPITRLRWIAANTIEEIELAVESLGFRIEIKGAPQFDPDEGGWILTFTLPDDETVRWKSIDLRD